MKIDVVEIMIECDVRILSILLGKFTLFVISLSLNKKLKLLNQQGSLRIIDCLLVR